MSGKIFFSGNQLISYNLLDDSFFSAFQSISVLPFQPNASGDRKYGAHGYDNELVEMRGFFVAKGPGKGPEFWGVIVCALQECMDTLIWCFFSHWLCYGAVLRPIINNMHAYETVQESCKWVTMNTLSLIVSILT